MGNCVDPLRNKRDIQRVADYLKSKNYRDYVLWFLGVTSGLRVSDILALNVKDVKNKRFVTIKEKKTRKMKQFPLTPELQLILRQFTARRTPDEPLFLGKTGKRLNRRQVYRFIKQACTALKLGATVGTHTMRKTFGYHHYRKHKDIAILQTIFNHSAPSITLRYIGVQQDEINLSYFALKLCA